MTPRDGRLRTALTVLTAWSALAGAALVGAAPASGVTGAHTWNGTVADAKALVGKAVAPGITYKEFDLPAAQGVARAHVLSVDLSNRHVRVDLLHSAAVASRAAVSRLAEAQGAVAGVNGDFFDISEAQRPGVEATGATVGPAIANGRTLKAAVPDGQRFGPALPPGTNTKNVLGVGLDGRARLDSLALDGSVRSSRGRWALGGLNQYALPQGSIGAFTSAWGGVSRKRAVCGTDIDRAAPCSGDTYEVTVRRGRVVSMAGTPGGGPIASGTTVLVGREAGAQQLRELTKGQAVRIQHWLVAAGTRIRYRFAIGGYPVLTHGQPLPGLNNTASAVRTAVGIANKGRRLLLLALDGAAAYRGGLTIAEVAHTMRSLGSVDAFSLDGGGSTTMVARMPGAGAVSVLNHPSGGAERPVPNGIGVFSHS
ncbi:phosphodiester glycosidase family protein [Streptomyces mirabilis]|uniref:phosphodiester glycosidase family protein n=1 Tax=Streptomyces TaxID=1883 RepID=UPI0029B1C800|nr:phosphodiester glycosidase family protein [Streptomyces sp. AK02-04a]MDX3759396.1 phosphodiester glycosidase family protein [Streptomyces sp. AK02-04a]